MLVFSCVSEVLAPRVLSFGSVDVLVAIAFSGRKRTQKLRCGPGRRMTKAIDADLA